MGSFLFVAALAVLAFLCFVGPGGDIRRSCPRDQVRLDASRQESDEGRGTKLRRLESGCLPMRNILHQARQLC